MIFSLLLFLLFPIVYGGSKCPERKDIYPCICINRAIGKKKVETFLVCRALTTGDFLSTIKQTLRSMEIEKLMLYDSFWSNNVKELAQDQRIPSNDFSTFKIKEVEIVDTSAASFGCPAENSCNINFLKRFSLANSSMSEGDSCGNNGNSITAWIGCPGDVEYVEIIRGLSTTGLKPEFFPQPMNELKQLRLPYNSISRIDKRTFSMSKFPKLEVLDLSHNYLREATFISSSLGITYLDLSHNNIRNLFNFQHLPKLHTLKLENCGIKKLLQNEWVLGAPKLRHVDLLRNDIDCDCESSKWINGTFHINTNFLGECVSPPEVANMKLRKASRFLNEKCDEKNKIDIHRKKAKAS